MGTAHIGIVACSAEGAALCFRTIASEGPALLGPHAHPEISLHAHSLHEYVERLDREDWNGVGELMLESARRLAKGGADFVICPDNTIHQALPLIEARLPVPWLHIADAVADEAALRGFQNVGILGTRWLVHSEIYPSKFRQHGIGYVRPGVTDRAEISRIIMEELVAGDFKPAAVAFHQQVIGRLKAAGCDSVVLGCTEIPLIINEINSPLPILDSTRLLARAALLRAAGQGGTSANSVATPQR
jgi:aspartate racemase